jgi:hypothetical protein
VGDAGEGVGGRAGRAGRRRETRNVHTTVQKLCLYRKAKTDTTIPPNIDHAKQMWKADVKCNNNRTCVFRIDEKSISEGS